MNDLGRELNSGLSIVNGYMLIIYKHVVCNVLTCERFQSSAPLAQSRKEVCRCDIAQASKEGL